MAHDAEEPKTPTEEQGELNEQAGAVRQLAGRLKGDRALEAKGFIQRAKGSLQKGVGAVVRTLRRPGSDDRR